ncbi:Arylsulfatase [Stieleria maiorica]|uniref:Arylsulfatase n=1 Tax=Stieleria maiorica TaxID=2795974 RepID=A0A5B9MPU0_9BACT|nr:sulfatase-like hydrolase/transferase [Stieleria maiorica]QEG02400.1 Arylsulfatase [Stieleria maiorica]
MIVLCLAIPLSDARSQEHKPNFIVILADDLGYGDLGCFGATDIRTPNIDSLARDGMKFTSFYVHQRCSPSRLAFMTGCYAHRVGTTKVIYPRDRMGINPAEITAPELLKKAGYTCGIVGKWHLGDWEPFHPLNHGFDYFKGAWHVAADDGESAEREGAFMENRTTVSETYRKCGETEHEEVNGALRFIEENRSRPFMLYYASRGTHSRWNPSPKFVGTSTRPNRYGDAVQELDFEVGRILQKLDEIELSQDTLVIFGSDNGAPLNSPGPSNAPLRDGKWTNFEGGIRTPWLMRWPGHIPANVTTERIAGIWDLLPTFCDIAGVAPPHDRVLDGVSILPVMLGEQESTPPRDSVIMDGSTIRMGDWKLFLKAEKPGGRNGGERMGTAAGTLFNMKTDSSETTDVAAENPDVVQSLRVAAKAFEQELANHSRPIGRLEGDNKDSAKPGTKTRKNKSDK